MADWEIGSPACCSGGRASANQAKRGLLSSLFTAAISAALVVLVLDYVVSSLVPQPDCVGWVEPAKPIIQSGAN